MDYPTVYKNIIPLSLISFFAPLDHNCHNLQSAKLGDIISRLHAN